MRVCVTVDDTSVEIEDDEPYSHTHATQMIDTVIGEVCAAYEAALHLAEPPSPKDFR